MFLKDLQQWVFTDCEIATASLCLKSSVMRLTLMWSIRRLAPCSPSVRAPTLEAYVTVVLTEDFLVSSSKAQHTLHLTNMRLWLLHFSLTLVNSLDYNFKRRLTSRGIHLYTVAAVATVVLVVSVEVDAEFCKFDLTISVCLTSEIGFSVSIAISWVE